MMTHMQETLSGGLVYEYSMHQGFSAGWGLVTNAASTCTDTETTRSNDATSLVVSKRSALLCLSVGRELL